MVAEVVTVVRGQVPTNREAELIGGFAGLKNDPRPAGLLKSELHRGEDGWWQIQTVWRDRTALDAMRAGSEPPAAPRLFRQVGAEPTLQIYEIVSVISAASEDQS
jgi:hypothetical protein